MPPGWLRVLFWVIVGVTVFTMWLAPDDAPNDAPLGRLFASLVWGAMVGVPLAYIITAIIARLIGSPITVDPVDTPWDH